MDKINVKVLGPGCAKCKKLAENTTQAAGNHGIDIDFEYVKDIEKILSYGVMMTPALVIDGDVKCSGKVPTTEQIKTFLTG